MTCDIHLLIGGGNRCDCVVNYLKDIPRRICSSVSANANKTRALESHFHSTSIKKQFVLHVQNTVCPHTWTMHERCPRKWHRSTAMERSAQKWTENFTWAFEKLRQHLHLDKSQNLQTSRFNVSDVYSRGEAERFIGLICWPLARGSWGQPPVQVGLRGATEEGGGFKVSSF